MPLLKDPDFYVIESKDDAPDILCKFPVVLFIVPL